MFITAVRDSACASRDDGPWSEWDRKDVLYPHADEGDDGLWRAPQGVEDEPQGHHGPADVRTPGRGHQ